MPDVEACVYSGLIADAMIWTPFEDKDGDWMCHLVRTTIHSHDDCWEILLL